MITESVKDWVYTCPECPQSFPRAESFQKHFLKYHEQKISACRNCPMFFYKLNQLFLHAREKHNIDKRQNKTMCKLQCGFEGCSYQTNNGGLMKHHYRSHTDFRPFVCEICNKTFTQKSNMKTHFNRHKKHTFKFECVPCDKTFNSHDIYLSHLETREHYLGFALSQIKVEFQCMICKDIFDNPVDTYNHGNVCKVENENQIDCQTCHISLPLDLDLLKEHMKFHKNEIVCPFCQDDTVCFTDKTAFNFHITKKHQKKVDRRKCCRYCEDVFENEAERLKHIEAEHPNLKNKHRFWNNKGRIKCDFENCEFTSNSEILLQKHLNSHYKHLDLDQFYKADPKDVEEKFEKSETVEQKPPAEVTRKRGRPRLCDSTGGSPEQPNSPPQLDGQLKRKRGRPQKQIVKTTDSLQTCRKRGRPKKVKCEETIPEVTEHDVAFFFHGHEDVDDDNEYTIDPVGEEFDANLALEHLNYPRVYHQSLPVQNQFIKEEETEIFDC